MQNLGNRDLSKQEVSALIDRPQLYWTDLKFDSVRVDDMSKLKKDGTLMMTKKDSQQKIMQAEMSLDRFDMLTLSEIDLDINLDLIKKNWYKYFFFKTSLSQSPGARRRER